MWFCVDGVMAMNRMAELKPCPFCGSAKISVDGMPVPLEYLPYYCQCEMCRSCGGRYKSELKAIEAWNRRAGNDDI